MIRGERFQLDLDSDKEQDSAQQSIPLPASFVGDVLERKAAAPTPPSAPGLKSKTGFPEHKKRSFESRCKQKQAASHSSQPPVALAPSPHNDPGDSSGNRLSGKPKSREEEEKERIDEENRQRIAQMSPTEIEEERRELMKNLSPAVLSRLLQRPTVESGSEEVDLSRAPEELQPEAAKPRKELKPPKAVKFEEPNVEEDVEKTNQTSTKHTPAAEEAVPESPPHQRVHFPRPPQPPSLDPSSETFLDDLHEKYFPSLPSDPDKLEWMQPSTSDNRSYDPSATNLSAKDLRFDFKGQLIPPRTASEIPVTKGLHHHGDAPDAAGYTVPELAHLARSTYPAQRCIAFQTLGRILYRLGRGEFGDSGEPGAETEQAQDTFGELARSLWGQIEALHVIPALVNESQGKGIDGGRHLSAQAYATEAVHLWQKGGGRRWKAA
ncbi:Hypothetical predicted protein [Lecanosticta acicola]|uniref:RNA polymerase II-associated protein RBA50 n=1 Tax=Lecanosticta acicola TaxID=111012 RepID=A0AAI8Z867_9PEZI|nr:Hypothetical predicted protein [Lecanosticta acicola]